MILEIITTTGCLLALLFFVFFLGDFSIWLVTGRNQHRSLSASFINLLVGSTVVVTLYALFVTGLSTVMMFFFVLLGAALIYLKTSFRFIHRYSPPPLSSFVIVFIAGALGNLLSYLVEWGPELYGDTLFYSKVSHWLSVVGIENSFHHYNLVEPQLNGATPYHYYELWLNNLLARLLPQFTSYTLLKYVTYGFFKASFILGLASIGTEISPKKPKVNFTLVMAFGLAFVSFSLISTYHPVIYGYNASLFGRPTYPVFFFALTGFLIFCVKEKYVLAMLTLSMLPIMTITAFPSVVLTYFVAIFYLVYTKRILKRDTIVLISSGLITFFGILIFYKFNKPDYSFLSLTVSGAIDRVISIWKAIVGQIAFISLSIGLFFLTITVISFKYKLFKKFRFPTLVLLGLFFFGVLSFQGLTKVDNSYQFQYISYALFYLLALSFLITYGLSSTTGKYIVGFMCIFFFSSRIINQDHYPILISSNSYKDYHLKLRGYDQSVIGEIEKDLGDQKVGVFYAEENVLQEVPPRLRDFSYMPIPNILGYINSDIRIYPIVRESAIYGSPIDSTKYEKAWKFNSFLKFYRDSLSIEQYIDYVNAEFVISVDSMVNQYKPIIRIFPPSEVHRNHLNLDH